MLRRSIAWMNVVSCDVCVIGAGPAGTAAALRACDFNKSVCLIEKSRIGGADLWNGALQSKTMWEVAKFVRTFRGDTSKRFCDPTIPAVVDNEKLRTQIVESAELREDQIRHQLKAAGVYTLFGNGMFNGPKEVEVQRNDGEITTVKADYYIIATGSTPRQHPQYPTNGRTIINSDTIMSQDLPESLVIVGAGVVGCEYASILANFGDTKVNVIEKASRILPMEDEDIALFIQTLLGRKGVTFHHRSALRSLNVTPNDTVKYTIRHNDSGERSTFEVDRALVSIGRVPNYVGLGLETLRGAQVENGKLVKDSFLRVKNFNHIYCCGDASMDIALVNVGELEGRRCVEHIYSSKPAVESRRFDNLTTIMFLDQEVAAVGRNEQDCQKERIAYRCAVYGNEFIGRALALGNTKGFVKLLCTNDREQRVLGVRAVGPQASSIVELASLAIHNNQSAYELQHLLTAYPAVSNGFQECVRMLLGKSILKPNVFPHLVVRDWNPREFESESRGRAYKQK